MRSKKTLTGSKNVIGWWNVDDSKAIKKKYKGESSSVSTESSNRLQMPPLREEMREGDFSSRMSPTRKSLLDGNRSLSELPSAVDTVKHIPSLSDRPPNNRHVQVDTQMVAFPSLGEVEPFFCRVSLWLHSSCKVDSETSSVRNKCGRITESLHFDVINDPTVEELCAKALFPPLYNVNQERYETSRCGVFSFPSCYDLNNVYVVIIVEKTLTEDGELEMYWNKNDDIARDISKCRSRAGRAADRLGSFLTPFAFGVAPLVKIIGSDSPSVPSSRAAQIPLFKFLPGEGDRQILNHIMAMSCPR